MADEMEKKLMRLKKEDLKEEARLRSLSETGTKAELVSYFIISKIFHQKKSKRYLLSFNFCKNSI